MNIKRTFGTIKHVTNLSATAKEILIDLDTPLSFIAGGFVNVFMDIAGEKTRRAYSISSSDGEQQSISIAVRLSPEGKMSPLFWKNNLVGEKLELMGPLGLNTAEKMHHKKIYLFAFGIGAGVVKSLADHFSNSDRAREIVIITGSRSGEEILYKNYFDALATKHKNVKVTYIVSKPNETSLLKKGYIQDNVKDFDFNKSDVYVCGQEVACNALVQKIKDTDPADCDFFIEGFH
jgi:NAD(P)H-flavin reductase